MNEFGRRIAQLRHERGLTQRGLGEKVGMSQQQIYMIEHDERGVSFAAALRLARALDVDVNILAQQTEAEVA